MSREGPSCDFTSASIVSWRKKLDGFDACWYFGRKPCSIAKGVFATGAVKSVHLFPHKAVINACFNGETINFEIVIDDAGNIETSIDKRKITSQIVTIAALMEIIVIVNSVNVDSIQKRLEMTEQISFERQGGTDPISSHTFFGGEHGFDGESVEEKCTGKKNVLVKFNVCGNDVSMRAFLDNSEKKPIFMQSSNSVTVISGNAKKMSLLRLLYYAKKAKFEFCASNRDYRIKNLRDATELMRERFDIWDKYFFVEISPEMLLLKRGIIFPAICAKVREPDPNHIQIEWIVDTPYGRIDSSSIQDLLRANGRSIFINGIGAVAMTAPQTSIVRHVFCSDLGTKLRKYMLYVLLNQNYIRVDASGCRITHIDVGIEKFALPEFLKNYQRDGVYAMRAILDAGCHCLLADEMGLGKTLQALTLVCLDKQNTHPGGKNTFTLIVCPASVIFVWQREIEKFFPEKTFSVVDRFYDFSKRPDFLICSYAQVHKMNAELRKLSFDYAILDEAQYIKNPRSKTTLACCNIDCQYRIAITGTPIENNPADIWSIFRFLMPGFFCGYRQFQQSIGISDFRSNFQKQIATFTIRRTKQSVAIELPKRNELELVCKMTPGQMYSYEAIKNGLKSKLQCFDSADPRTRMNILTSIMRLRQAACAQFILPEHLRYDSSMESQKIDILMLKLENVAADGKKAIVFSQFLDFLKQTANRMAESLGNMKVFSLTGATQNRKAVVEEFQSISGAATMLISLKAGGVGITLHAAEYVFLMEPWWNPAVEEQAIARIHRIGQKNVVTVYRILTAESIEMHMREIQVSKGKLFNEFIKTGV
ncbi:MAG: DEAD/DEAH box helicase, partial [Puniceicoccales bacterium]|nr:DEAD/DEAH box helicase [Puniceicoccales bacterium]